MKTLANNNSNESINGMSQVIIDMRPQVKHHEGYGREKVADVYFRTLVRAYSRQICGDYSEAAHEAAKQALKAYYSEVVELLKGEGWTLLNENYAKWKNCPEMVKGAQYLYIHPDEICGEVNPADIDALEAKFKALTACEYRGTDNYGDIVLTRSEADERMLYRETYTEGIADTIKECTTTKRSNLYKDRGDALGCIRNRIAIQNKRTDLTGHGTGYYRERNAVAGFVQEEYDRLLQAGYIKEAKGQNGRTLCRWINKKEEKELNKARREAEKQAKAEAEAKALQEAAEIAAAEGIEVGSFVKINTDGHTAIVTGIGLVIEGHGVLLYLDDFTNWCQDCREKNGYNIIMSSDEVIPLTEDDYKPKADIKDDYKKGDRVRHNQSGRVATIEGVRVTSEMKVFGEYRKVYRLNFGESVPGPFDTELNGGEFIAEAITLESASEITGVYVSVCDGIVQDVLPNKDMAIQDMRRHVNNTLVGCCGGVIKSETETRWEVDFPAKNRSEVCEVVRFDPNNEEHRKAYNAERSIWNLPELAPLETASEITEQREQNDACISSAESRRDKANGQITEKPQPSSWVTDYTYDDFAKLEANPEAIEADPDIMGKRFRLTAKDGSAPLSELQVFIQDYAGNERHALYYIWDEWMQEVRANVRPLDWLREHFCHANGWQPVAA